MPRPKSAKGKPHGGSAVNNALPAYLPAMRRSRSQTDEKEWRERMPVEREPQKKKGRDVFQSTEGVWAGKRGAELRLHQNNESLTLSEQLMQDRQMDRWVRAACRQSSSYADLPASSRRNEKMKRTTL
mmetsp:Transcript_637/g.1412  ORF Transcript_637/g.1412 Transcript_637/m.1412 type:complete len:128 (+) Transcript_637:1497-1880(+)